MKRRNLLAAICSAPLLCKVFGGQSASAEQAVVGTTDYKQLAGWLDELLQYEKAMLDAGQVSTLPAAMSIPFGAKPINFYARRPEAVNYIPRGLASLRELWVHDDDRVAVQQKSRLLFRAYMVHVLREKLPESRLLHGDFRKPTSKEIEQFSQCGMTLALPDRVTTPDFVLCADSAELTTDVLAMIYVRAGHTLAEELRKRVDAAVAAFRKYIPETPYAIQMRHGLPNMCVRREAFLLSTLFWMETAGRVVPADRADTVCWPTHEHS